LDYHTQQNLGKLGNLRERFWQAEQSPEKEAATTPAATCHRRNQKDGEFRLPSGFWAGKITRTVPVLN
jgi:hypothetical protein